MDQGMISWKKLAPGCAQPQAGNAKQFNTGDWRSRRKPVTDREKCIKCGLCYIICPDMCYTEDPKAEGYYNWDGFYCKGCGICVVECPKQAISWVDEKEEEKYGPACGA